MNKALRNHRLQMCNEKRYVKTYSDGWKAESLALSQRWKKICHACPNIGKRRLLVRLVRNLRTRQNACQGLKRMHSSEKRVMRISMTKWMNREGKRLHSSTVPRPSNAECAIFRLLLSGTCNMSQIFQRHYIIDAIFPVARRSQLSQVLRHTH